MSGFRPSIRILAAVSVTATALLLSVSHANAATPKASTHTAKPSKSATHSTKSATHSKQTVAQQNYTFYDSTVPSEIPAHQLIAAYADGDYKVPRSSVSDPATVIWIDVNGGDANATALDVEPGDATPAGAAQWVNAKLTATPHSDAIVYTFKSDWTSVQNSIHQLPSWEQSHVKYWIADPTGTPHIVPGAAATQWYWGSSYDISQATPGFFS
jgi:hypothetical protein